MTTPPQLPATATVRPDKWVVELFCKPFHLVCMRQESAVALGEWVQAASGWMLETFVRCGLPPRPGSFGGPVESAPAKLSGFGKSRPE